MSAYVYAYWADETPLYVGVTVDVLRRARQHLGKPWAKEATHISVTEFTTPGDAYSAEVSLIGRLQPLYNKMHNPRFKRHIYQLTLTPAELLEGDREAARVMDRIFARFRESA